MTDTDLRAAVAEIKEITPEGVDWIEDDLSTPFVRNIRPHIATILNAVASGDLVLKADVEELVEALSKPTSGGERKTFSCVGHHLKESSWHVHLAGFCSADDAVAALAALTAWENRK